LKRWGTMTQVFGAFAARVPHAMHVRVSSNRSSAIAPTSTEEPKGENTQ
jgi:hypothetical protein